MSRPHYSWWGHVKAIVRAYPGRCGRELYGVASRDQKGVEDAIAVTERMGNGESRLKLIRIVHWDRTHTVEGAMIAIPCSKTTAYRWQKDFFEIVARNRDMLD